MARKPALSVEKTFTRKFGENFLASVPRSPGVYFIFDSTDNLIYIGKAKNLRRRLGQYKNARRRKKHAKMRQIVTEAARIEIRLLPSDFDACIEETRLIQEHRPKWNIAGAFYFLYPMIGIRQRDGLTRFCYTTEPERFPDFDFHGAYRSRHITKDAFFALMELLGYVGHRVRQPSLQAGTERRSYIVAFRQLPAAWSEDWSRFFKGDSKAATEQLVLALVENAGARHSPARIQESLNLIKRFWRHEASPLRRAIEQSRCRAYPVSQRQRDIIFLESKNRKVRRAHFHPLSHS